ncbi:MAG: DNA repair protein RadC [Flavobacteriaceae bacterium]|nr:DNA repair protein RadC [Flavobacteriaceae bacterium]
MMAERKSFSIKSWNEDDRPREKLLAKGKNALSNAELIAILLGSGSRHESAVDLAKRMLNFTQNNLNAFSKLTVNDLVRFKGVGEVKAITIITALELARRCRLEDALQQELITSSKTAFEMIHPLLGELPHEEFWIIYLNNANKVLDKMQLSKGGLTGTLVDSRMIFKRAVELLATGIILCHNHPSGKLNPSESDKKLTQKIKQAGEALDIKVLDHLIITEKDYFSFADNNLL